jgi:hypothetical protein
MNLGIFKDFGPLLITLSVKTLLYVAVFRVRKHHVTIMTSIILGASPLIAGGLGLGFLPLPEFITWLLVMGLTIFFLVRFTEVDPFPEGIIIIFGVEFVSAVLSRLVIIPLVMEALSS